MTDEATNAATDESETRVASAQADGRYRVEELFAFHDRAFVENAFRAALGRAPDAAELDATLTDLRAARRSKREIVEDLVFSEEGERSGARARVEGVGDPRLKRRVRALPVVGYLWQLLAGLARLPRLMRHQREFEAYAVAQQQLLADRLDEMDEQQRRAQELIDDAREAVFMLSDALATQSARQAQAEARLDAQQHRFDAQQHRLDGQQHRLDAQEEFLIQEQRAIVEAQKTTLAEIEERLREVDAAARRALAASAVEPHGDATAATRDAREA